MGHGPASPTGQTTGQTAVTRDDFRIRKSAAGYRVWQYEGGRWHGMCDVWPTRADAAAWIAAALAPV